MKKSQIRRQMSLMKTQGIDEFFIFAIYGLEYPRFLEDSWFDYVEFTIHEAKKRDMRVWIYDDLNWPSGTAAGHMTRDNPEHRMRSIIRQACSLIPGEVFSYNLGVAPERVFIRRASNSAWEQIELTDNMYCNNSDVNLELQCFDVQFFNYHPLGARGTSNTWNQRGLCDLLSKPAVECWMSHIHDRYYEKFAPECGKTLRGFFFDEPHFMPNYGELPWTPGLFEKFHERYGYDFRDRLPAFFENIAGAEQVRYDFWSLIAELSSESFGKTVADWCDKRGLLSTGHCVYEEISDQALRLCFNGEIHGILKHQHIPGMDLLNDNTPYHLGTGYRWYGKTPETARTFLFTAKQACSTARYSGAKRVMAEAMGVLSLNTPLSREKIVFDWLSGCGISLLNENGFIYTISGFRKRTLSNKHWTQPWFKHYKVFSEYCREMSRFGSGVLQTEIAVLTPESTIRACTPITPNKSIPAPGSVAGTVLSTLNTLMRNHLDFELMFEDVFLQATVDSGIIQAPNSAFKVLIIPQNPVLSPAVAAKLRKFINSGGVAIFVGCRSERLPDGKPVAFADVPLLEVSDLPETLSGHAALPYSLRGDGADEVFSALRECAGIPTLLLANMNPNAVEFQLETTLPVPIAAHIPGEAAVWNFTDHNIRLEPEQSLILEFGKSAEAVAPAAGWKISGKTLALLDGPWKYKLGTPNNALCSFELGLAPNDEAGHPEKIKCWIPVSRDGCYGLDIAPCESPYYWLRGGFRVEHESVIPSLALIVEPAECDRIVLNGKVIENATSYELWDQQNRKYALDQAAKIGDNQLLLRCKTSMWAALERITIFRTCFIEPIVLHGNFATASEDIVPRLFPLPDTLEIGDVKSQGLPWYVGDISLTRTIGAQAVPGLYLPELSAGAVAVKLNNVTCGIRLWRPYYFDLSPAWRQNNNHLDICLSGNLGNLIPRAYGARKITPVPFGLLSPPQLIER